MSEVLRALMIGNFLSASGKTPQVCETLSFKLTQAGLSVLNTSKKPSRMARMLDMIWSTYRWRGGYDIAHMDVYSGPSFLWAEACGMLLKSLGKPFIVTLHGGRLPEFSRANRLRVTRLLGDATAVTTPSHYLAESMQIYRRDLRVIPNPVEISNYPFRLRKAPQPRLVWLRAFHQIYNPQLAVRTLYALKSQFPDIQLTMIGHDRGDGSLEQTLRLAKALLLEEHIRFIPGVPKDEVPSYLSQGDVFLNTTTIDNTPVSVIEAMACGLCVVSTNVGGLPYLLREGEDALLVPSDDLPRMVEAVRTILQQPAVAERLSRQARRKTEGFDWAKVLPEWLKLFAACARGNIDNSKRAGGHS